MNNFQVFCCLSYVHILKDESRNWTGSQRNIFFWGIDLQVKQSFAKSIRKKMDIQSVGPPTRKSDRAKDLRQSDNISRINTYIYLTFTTPLCVLGHETSAKSCALTYWARAFHLFFLCSTLGAEGYLNCWPATPRAVSHLPRYCLCVTVTLFCLIFK